MAAEINEPLHLLIGGAGNVGKRRPEQVDPCHAVRPGRGEKEPAVAQGAPLVKEQGAEGSRGKEVLLAGILLLQRLIADVRRQNVLDALVVQSRNAGVHLDEITLCTEVCIHPDTLLLVIELVVRQRGNRRGGAGDDGDVPGHDPGLQQAALGVGPAGDKAGIRSHAEIFRSFDV